MNRLVLISGCSGGGKSTLLAELGRRGYAIVEEPGRRIVRQELESDGAALPWIDMAAFARRAIEMATADHAATRGRTGWTFFDRGLIDAAAALQHLTGEPALERLSALHRYNSSVFLTPPWPEIYVADPERRHAFDEAVAEYDRLAATYPALGYDVVMLPKIAVADRADFILDRLEVT
ncbi:MULTISPECIES: AAA family ATPase [unclassified Rhizobium]|uniref:AAA family ATPase n=1 Tax=unclassified Rhizobium TaxID=2613769 RepID=UPI0007EBDC14|nr:MULTISPECIES: AAA family ATPase [unclassified Rhizobium]ANM10955.1 P-loop NTPase domain-containing protein [Rhizobium sp. N324]ANM17497.1 P-loop NTPase domain-containing protein [Rhizobium sp. N541]ANM23882.1 P-loop NTPase domain-containing protein [Rhizobium sp. N941]OYD04556.1 P-loop NTPase domain-containing protein [Rhizobium sp. N4311]